MDTSFSIFSPIAVYDSAYSDTFCAQGKFGEWLLNFSRKVYHIRTDGLQSDVGTEVIEAKYQEQSYEQYVRIALCIMVLPAVIAFIDRIIHRWQYDHVHINLLPDHLRHARVIMFSDRLNFCHGNHKRDQGNINWIGWVLTYQMKRKWDSHSIFLACVQPKPWIVQHQPFRFVLIRITGDGLFMPQKMISSTDIPDAKKLDEVLDVKNYSWENRLDDLPDERIYADKTLCYQGNEFKYI